MNRNLLLAIVTLPFITCQAQINGNTINPVMGDTIDITICCSTVSDAGMSGTNVTWDFSNADTMNSEVVTFTPPFPNVPGSNITSIQTINNDPSITPITDCLYIDTNERNFLGSPTDVYTNPRKVLEFP